MKNKLVLNEENGIAKYIDRFRSANNRQAQEEVVKHYFNVNFPKLVDTNNGRVVGILTNWADAYKSVSPDGNPFYKLLWDLPKNGINRLSEDSLISINDAYANGTLHNDDLKGESTFTVLRQPSFYKTNRNDQEFYLELEDFFDKQENVDYVNDIKKKINPNEQNIKTNPKDFKQDLFYKNGQLVPAEILQYQLDEWSGNSSGVERREPEDKDKDIYKGLEGEDKWRKVVTDLKMNRDDIDSFMAYLNKIR